MWYGNSKDMTMIKRGDVVKLIKQQDRNDEHVYNIYYIQRYNNIIYFPLFSQLEIRRNN